MNWQETVPTSIKVGYRTYSVSLMDHWESTDKQAFGRCDNNGGRIELDAHMDAPKAANTLLHELMHAVWYVWGMDRKVEEEPAVTIMSNGLTTIMRDNPAFGEWTRECLA